MINLTVQFRETLEGLRKKAFQLYVQGFQPFLENIKHIFQHNSPKAGSIFQYLTMPRFLLWLGIATGVTGLLVILKPDTFINWQILLILLIAILGPWFLDFFRESSEEAKDDLESYDGREFIGKTLTLKVAIVNNEAQITIGDRTWLVIGNDCPAGTCVKVIAISEETMYVLAN